MGTVGRRGNGSGQPADLLLRMTIAIGVGLVILIGSHRIFLRLQGDFAQEL